MRSEREIGGLAAIVRRGIFEGEHRPTAISVFKAVHIRGGDAGGIDAYEVPADRRVDTLRDDKVAELLSDGYARNQWGSLVRYLDDGRFAIDNGAAERAIRPLAVGRSNWLHIGGDGGLKTASVLLSVCASASRHRLNPWTYLRDALDQLAVRSAGADLGDLSPDAWAKARGEPRHRAG